MIPFLIENTSQDSNSYRLGVPDGTRMSRRSNMDEAQASEDTVIIHSHPGSVSAPTPRKEPVGQAMNFTIRTVRVLHPSNELTQFPAESSRIPATPLAQRANITISLEDQVKRASIKTTENGTPRHSFKVPVFTPQKQSPKRERGGETRGTLQGKSYENRHQLPLGLHQVRPTSHPASGLEQAYQKEDEEEAVKDSLPNLAGSKDCNHHHIHHHYYSPSSGRRRRRYHSWHHRREYDVSPSKQVNLETRAIDSFSKHSVRHPVNEQIKSRHLEHVRVLDQGRRPRISLEDFLEDIQHHHQQSTRDGQSYIYTHVSIPKSKKASYS
jgi:hypothetical protein